MKKSSNLAHNAASPSTAVLIPVFNDGPGLKRTLASLADDDGTFDVVIVDDGSVPPLPQMMTCGEHSVTVIRQQRNMGIAKALNRGLIYVLSRGYNFVARIDARDLAVAGRMAMQEAYLREHPSCGLVGSFVDFVDEQGALRHRHRPPAGHEQIMRQMHINNCILHASVMMRAGILRLSGFYPEASGTACEDYVLFVGLARYCRLAVIPKVLTVCEDSKTGISAKRRHEQQLSRLRIQCKYFDPRTAVSYYGFIRTLVAMMTPRLAVLWYKRSLRSRG
jgi:glycosyltransferase involved in cell wall biosynthesis